MTPEATDLVVRKSITVHAPREHSFEVFTERMGSRWPLVRMWLRRQRVRLGPRRA